MRASPTGRVGSGPPGYGRSGPATDEGPGVGKHNGRGRSRCGRGHPLRTFRNDHTSARSGHSRVRKRIHSADDRLGSPIPPLPVRSRPAAVRVPSATAWRRLSTWSIRVRAVGDRRFRSLERPRHSFDPLEASAGRPAGYRYICTGVNVVRVERTAGVGALEARSPGWRRSIRDDDGVAGGETDRGGMCAGTFRLSRNRCGVRSHGVCGCTGGHATDRSTPLGSRLGPTREPLPAIDGCGTRIHNV